MFSCLGFAVKRDLKEQVWKGTCTKSRSLITFMAPSSLYSTIQPLCSLLKLRHLEILQHKMALLTGGEKEDVISRKFPGLSGKAAFQPGRRAPRRYYVGVI
jgi:hypothetical protein